MLTRPFSGMRFFFCFSRFLFSGLPLYYHQTQKVCFTFAYGVAGQPGEGLRMNFGFLQQAFCPGG